VLAIDGHQPTAHTLDGAGGGSHAGVVRADDHQVVVIVGDRPGNRSTLQADAVNEALAHVAGGMVPLDDGHLQQVAGRVGDSAAVHDLRVFNTVLGEKLVFQAADDAHPPPTRRNGEVHRVPGDVHRARQRRNLRRGNVHRQRAAACHQPPPGKDQLGARRIEGGEGEQIGAAARRDGSPVVQPEVLRRVERAHANGRHRVQPTLGNSHADHVVNRAVVEQVGGLAVVGAPADAAAILRRDQWQQRAQVLGVGRLADEDDHALLQLLARLVNGGALVVAADASGNVGVQVAPAQAGAVPVQDAPAVRRDLAQHARIGEDDAGIVHHLSQAQHPGMVAQRRQVGGVEGCARRLHVRGRDAA